MSKKRKELAEADSPLAKKHADDDTLANGSSFTPPIANSSSKETQDTKEKVKNKKKKKDKDKELEHGIEHSVELEDTREKVKKRKKKKDKDKELEHGMENSVEDMDTSSTTCVDVATSNTFPNERSTGKNQVSEDTHEDVKKKKKRKKDKKRKQEEETMSAQHGEVDLAPDQARGCDHAPADIGEVDTDILKQASVNLGLPLADEASNTASSAQEKVKKKKKKKDKDKESKSQKEPEDLQNEDTNPDNSVLNYLRLWQSDRKAWKFNKRLQIRLIHNMYSRDKLSDEDFEIFLLYLDGMQGKSREKTRDDAGKIVTEDAEEADKIMHDRARQVFQMLS